MSLIDSAISFAATAHAGQVRRYDNLPYIVHPIEVMSILKTQATGPVSEEQLIAAVLHDVVEDTTVSLETIGRRFGKLVFLYVMELTDEFVSENYPAVNRKKRKELERHRLSCISPEAQSVKYADLISNTKSIVAHDPGFARTYLKEKEALLDVMLDGDEGLRLLAIEVLAAGQTELMQGSLR